MDIYAVNASQRCAVTDGGDVCEITNLYDADGEETDDPAQAVSAVARLDDDNWFAIDLTAFETVGVH